MTDERVQISTATWIVYLFTRQLAFTEVRVYTRCAYTTAHVLRIKEENCMLVSLSCVSTYIYHFLRSFVRPKGGTGDVKYNFERTAMPRRNPSSKTNHSDQIVSGDYKRLQLISSPRNLFTLTSTIYEFITRGTPDTASHVLLRP